MATHQANFTGPATVMRSRFNDRLPDVDLPRMESFLPPANNSQLDLVDNTELKALKTAATLSLNYSGYSINPGDTFTIIANLPDSTTLTASVSVNSSHDDVDELLADMVNAIIVAGWPAPTTSFQVGAVAVGSGILSFQAPAGGPIGNLITIDTTTGDVQDAANAVQPLTGGAGPVFIKESCTLVRGVGNQVLVKELAENRYYSITQAEAQRLIDSGESIA